MTLEQELPVNKILQGDCLARLKELPKDCIDCCITSPPYWAQRDYQSEGQLGLEPTFEEYLDRLMAILTEVQRVLKPTGTCFVNIGDTYSGSGGAGGDYNKGGIREGQPRYKQQKPMNVRAKSLCGIPERFHIAMLESDWIGRNRPIWAKENCMPDSGMDRFTNDYENIYYYVKSNEKIYWTNDTIEKVVLIEPLGTQGIENIDWIWNIVDPEKLKDDKGQLDEKKLKRVTKGELIGREANTFWAKESLWEGHDYFFETPFEPYKTEAKNGKMPPIGGVKKAGGDDATYSGNMPNWKFGRKKRSVWHINTQQFSEAHFAVYPEALVTEMLLPGCPEYICKKCGAPKNKVYKESRINTRPGIDTGNGKSGKELDPNQLLHNSDLSKFRQKIVREASGYTDCGCNAGFDGGIVLDPFFGSGTTGLVALKHARRFIGIELNEEYIKMAQKRLEPFLNQTRLF